VIISVKLSEQSEELHVKYSDIVPGYYLNKMNWRSVFLIEDLLETVLKQMLNMSQ
jgi:predicted DNA-binding protein (MmcQ/YjbR family)